MVEQIMNEFGDCRVEKDPHGFTDRFYDDSGTCKYIFSIEEWKDSPEDNKVWISTEEYYNKNDGICDQGASIIKSSGKFGEDHDYLRDGTFDQIEDDLKFEFDIEENSESCFTKGPITGGGPGLTDDDLEDIRQYLLNHPRFSREVDD